MTIKAVGGPAAAWFECRRRRGARPARQQVAVGRRASATDIGTNPVIRASAIDGGCIAPYLTLGEELFANDFGWNWADLRQASFAATQQRRGLPAFNWMLPCDRGASA